MQNKSKNATIIEMDFSKVISKQNDIAKSKITGKRLMSFSSFTKYLSEISMQSIPEHVLLNKKNFGKNIMTHLQFLFDNKVKNLGDYEFFSDTEKLAVTTILQEFVDNGGKISAVEKCITNDYGYGYIDILVRHANQTNYRYKILELKTSTSNELKFRHIMQVAIYAAIMLENGFCNGSKRNLDIEVGIYNTKSFELVKHKLTGHQINQAIKFINNTLELFDLNEYKLLRGK